MKRFIVVLAIALIFLTTGCDRKQSDRTSSPVVETDGGVVSSPGRGTVQEKQKFPITVNYDLTIEEAVTAGKYFMTDPDLTSKQFPRTRRGTEYVESVLVCFADELVPAAVARELETLGFRSTNVRELLAFGATYPKLQEDISIMALEAGRDGRKGARLYGSPSERNITLYGGDTIYPDECFAAASVSQP